MQSGEGIICFCYRKSLADLKQGLAEHGTLDRMQEAMRVGMACGGCRAMLHHHFGGGVAHINDFSVGAGGTTCAKPGSRTMKGFIASSSLMESHIFSCNAVPLQLGACDAGTDAEFVIYNHLGRPIYSRKHHVASGETFHFDTALARLPRPFYGMVTYSISRGNLGPSRFNVSWYREESSTSTHENASTGRPDVVLPIAFDHRFLNGPNDVYLAVQNPHAHAINLVFRVFRMGDGNLYDHVDTQRSSSSFLKRLVGIHRRTAVEWHRRLPSMGTLWIPVHDDFMLPAAKTLGIDDALALRIYAPECDMHMAPSTYFFFHHKPTNVLSCNHL